MGCLVLEEQHSTESYKLAVGVDRDGECYKSVVRVSEHGGRALAEPRLAGESMLVTSTTRFMSALALELIWHRVCKASEAKVFEAV
jgi:hypothetical protein